MIFILHTGRLLRMELLRRDYIGAIKRTNERSSDRAVARSTNRAAEHWSHPTERSNKQRSEPLRDWATEHFVEQ